MTTEGAAKICGFDVLVTPSRKMKFIAFTVQVAGPTRRLLPDGKGVAYVDAATRSNIWIQPVDGGTISAHTIRRWVTDRRLRMVPRWIAPRNHAAEHADRRGTAEGGARRSVTVRL
jgi:hypothetical protein